jgi:hypothetical protein
MCTTAERKWPRISATFLWKTLRESRSLLWSIMSVLFKHGCVCVCVSYLTVRFPLHWRSVSNWELRKCGEVRSWLVWRLTIFILCIRIYIYFEKSLIWDPCFFHTVGSENMSSFSRLRYCIFSFIFMAQWKVFFSAVSLCWKRESKLEGNLWLDVDLYWKCSFPVLWIYWISSRRQPRRGGPPAWVGRGANNSSP